MSSKHLMTSGCARAVCLYVIHYISIAYEFSSESGESCGIEVFEILALVFSEQTSELVGDSI